LLSNTDEYGTAERVPSNGQPMGVDLDQKVGGGTK